MRNLFWLTTLIILSLPLPAQAVELRSLADCSVKVFREINRSSAWSGKPPAGCRAEIYVDQRVAGIFVTTWNSGRTADGWERVALSVAMGFPEVAARKSLARAGRDITARTAHLERCLDSILRVNDPLDCRDRAAKTYSAGEETGTEFNREIWLDDNGRHSIVEYSYGDTTRAVNPPADLFAGPALPPGTKLNIHIFDSQ
jgi:hypothetical protein